MKQKQLNPEELNLATLASQYSDEDKARGLLEKMRWPDGVTCPKCGNQKDKPIYSLIPKAGSKSPVRAGVYCCGACRKQFTVKVGTIFEDSHIPISKWLMAMFILCSSKKSISAHQIHRMIGITYKTAWFMCHRIRYAMGTNPYAPKLTGTVEVDETFVGGTGETKTKHLRKTPVVALIERDGNMRTAVVTSVTQKNLGKILNEVVSKDTIVHTDEHPAYANPLKSWKAHHTVVHSKYEYSRKLADGTKAGINTCESFSSLLSAAAWLVASRQP